MILKYLSILIIFFSLTFCAYSQTIYQKGDSIVISRFGESFFKKYITAECLYCHCKWFGKDMIIENCADSDKSCTYYQFSYRISIPEKEINFSVQFSLDKNRDSLYSTPSFPPEKLCRKQLNFLSKKEIEKIAYNRRFEEGLKAWRFNLSWITKPYDEWYLQRQTEKIKKWGKGKFVWSVENELIDSAECIEGHVACFDAVTGEYLYELLELGIP
jgi:hypothetical protein